MESICQYLLFRASVFVQESVFPERHGDVFGTQIDFCCVQIEVILQKHRCHLEICRIPSDRGLSLRTWSLLNLKAVSAILADLPLGDLAKENLKRSVHSYLGYAPSGIKLATGCQGGLLRIVDAVSGVVEQEVDHGARHQVNSVAWSPSGVKVATGSNDGQLRIVDAASGVVEQEVGHGDPVSSVAWSP